MTAGSCKNCSQLDAKIVPNIQFQCFGIFLQERKAINVKIADTGFYSWGARRI